MPVPTISPSPCTAWPSPTKKERAGHEDREVDGDAGDEAAIVHVAAVLGRGGGRDRLVARRRDAEAAQHRREGRPQAPARAQQRARRAGCQVERQVVRMPLGQAGDVVRIDDVGGQRRAGPARVAVWGSGDPGTTSVSPGSALDEEGAGHRVAGRGDLLAAASCPPASTVVVLTVSPSATVRTGAWEPMVVW